MRFSFPSGTREESKCYRCNVWSMSISDSSSDESKDGKKKKEKPQPEPMVGPIAVVSAVMCSRDGKQQLSSTLW